MKKIVKLLSMTILVFLSLISCFTKTEAVSWQKPYKLLVYYGTPQGVNGTWNDNLAAQVFANYDYIVFGDGLENPKNEFNASTKNIIAKIHNLNPKSIIFGYVDLGVSTTNLSFSVMQSYCDHWLTIGADGIFLDDAGYDYATPRSRLNAMLDYIHQKSMPTIVNAWNADDVMGNNVDTTYNPTGELSYMGSNDYFLLESFVVAYDDYPNTQGFAPSALFKEHLDKAMNYRKQLGVKLLGLNSAPFSKLSNNEINRLFKLSETAAVIGSLDGYGLTPVNYSAGPEDADVFRVFDYLPNYYNYYTTDVRYQLSSDANVFSRNGFVIDLTPGKQSYIQPVTNPTITVPSPPTKLAANNITQTTVNLSWDQVSNADSYNIYQNDILVANGIKNTIYLANQLTKNTYYNFQVTTVNSAGESSKSNMIEITTLVDISNGLVANADSPWTVKLSWNPVPGAYTYNVYQNGMKIVDGLLESKFLASDLTSNTSYQYTVTAINAGGETIQSSPVNITTPKES